MSSKAELDAEALIYTVAAEIGLTEFEERRLDTAGIAAEILTSLRIEIKKQAGRTTTIEDYLLPDSEKVIDLQDALRRLGERHVSRTQ
jgi:hypothetical protein